MTTTSESFPAGIDVDDSLDVLQQNVQRHLGRCMLRLQQYERLLKTMVARMTLEGPLEQLYSLRAQQDTDASGKTLGTLIKIFTGSHLMPAVPEGTNPQYDEVKGDGPSGDAAWARMHFNIAMSPELYSQTKAGLAELVSLRNDLVHHLIDRFNISDKSGCRNAAQHLKSCYEQIDGHVQQLQNWATGFANAHAMSMSVLHSSVFEDIVVHGINPDGSVSWEQSSIVECLREAEISCQVAGWTSLDEAVAYIARIAPDQFPGKYACKTWRQVLMKSKLFEYQSTRGSAGSRGQARYRTLPDCA